MYRKILESGIATTIVRASFIFGANNTACALRSQHLQLGYRLLMMTFICQWRQTSNNTVTRNRKDGRQDRLTTATVEKR